MTPTAHNASAAASPVTDVDLGDLTGRLHIAVARLIRRLRREVPSALGQSAISTLATLTAEGPLRLGDLAVREGVRPPTMTRIVAALEEDGYVSRKADPADRRACLLQATGAGAALIAGAKSARADRLAAHLAELTPEQRAALAAALPALEALTGGA
jgi:DNA-binding MarR family transcriptional regulator